MKSQEIEDLIAVFSGGNDEAAEELSSQLIARKEYAWQLLAPLFKHTDADVRWWATRVAAGIPHPGAAAQMASSLKDEDLSVRQCAAIGLREQPSVTAVSVLLACLDDPDPLLRRLCGDALIATGAEAVPALIEALERGSQTAQREVARALAEIGDTRAIGPLFRAWEGGSSVVRYWAEIGIDRMGVGMRFFKP